jgi:hypothetical protein
MFNTIKKFTSALAVSLLALTLSFSSLNASAAGLTMTISANSSVAVSVTANPTFTFTTLTAIPSGGTVIVNAPAGYTLASPTATCTSGTVAVVGSVFTCTTSAIVPASTAFTFTVTAGVTSPATAGNYAWVMRTSTGDFSAALQYVGLANQVTVRAFVPSSLSFVIRNAGDTANTNTCDLALQSSTTITTCAYRLKVATNAANGYQVAVTSDRAFCNAASGAACTGTYTVANGASTSTGTVQVAGTEIYGAAVKLGAVTGAGGTVAGGNGTTNVFSNYATTFTGGTTAVSNITYTTATNFLKANKKNNPLASADTTNTSEVTHAMAIDANTEVGQYEHVLTYTVTPAF